MSQTAEEEVVTMPLDSMRHISIYDPEQYANKRVAVIGVGTIGSHLANILARMQVPMTLYDGDTIEEHNLATQSYGQSDIGKTKVAAVMEQLEAIGGVKHYSIEEFYRGPDAHDSVDLIASCVDTLDGRRAIATALIEQGREVPIVDGRVGREQGEVYYFPNPQAWLDQLPAEGDVDPCGARFTAYTAYVVAGFMANNIKRLLLSETVTSRIIYEASTSTFLKVD